MSDFFDGIEDNAGRFLRERSQAFLEWSHSGSKRQIGRHSIGPARAPSGLRGHLPLRTQTVYPQFDFIAGLQEDGRLESSAHATRRPCGDHIARQQRHETTQIADQKRCLEHELLGIAVLHHLAVHLEPDTQLVRISQFIRRREKRAQWRERIIALALDPLPLLFVLKRPL